MEEELSDSRTRATPLDTTKAESADAENGAASLDAKERGEGTNGKTVNDDEDDQNNAMEQLPPPSSATRGSRRKTRGSKLCRVLPTTSRSRAHQRLDDDDLVSVRVGCADPRMSALELADAALAAAQSRVRGGAGHVRLAS